MDSLFVITSGQDGTRLSFSDASGDTFVATMEGPHFRGRVVVSTYVSGPPSLLFHDMARDWSGWEGEKGWFALDDELRITASSDHTGHITLEVVMRQSNPSNWILEAKLELEAGQLHTLAREAKKLFAGFLGAPE